MVSVPTCPVLAVAYGLGIRVSASRKARRTRSTEDLAYVVWTKAESAMECGTEFEPVR